METQSFAKDALERAVKSAGQAVLALVPLDGFNVLHADWKLGFGVAAGAMVLSFATSLASLKLGDKGTASAVRL